ncbi:hypothetical protein KVH02_29110 [Streptomyces olivaceus]|uniref:Superfamily III holin-X n=1 Tax=Streptomyces olivaceus TaxID=47716 RepID=A0ABS7W2Y9_STROV|nr:hypothetical protein [Streptomyces olivaceus]MBZ6098629.1 hypothetical protein [Streptomyces olivaceus]MBZ6119991.1 hypothetical protein [Streptomyces olivaceus]MBZ6152354.1 hypothetical protein [Streptomyces olivaceus]MBZ6301204.1 hypothetical protein [Streptomyces olivaceus]
MVSRSIVQVLRELAQAAFGSGMNDEELKAQAIQDPEQAERLIAIESARANAKFKLLALVGFIAVLVILSLIVAALFVIDKAGDLKLPWSSIRTVLGTLLGAPMLSALAWWAVRKLRGRRGGGPTPQAPPESRSEGDQNQVGTS